MPGSRQTTTTQQNTSPWAPAQGALQNIIGQAETLGGNTANFTPTYSGATMQGIQGLEQAGQQPGAAANYLSGLVQNAGAGANVGAQQLMQTASGGMQGNPYMTGALDYAANNTANRVNQQFSGAGRYGSAAHTGALTREIGGLETNAMMDQYNRERGNQMQAANTLYGGGFQGASAAGQLDQANLYDEQALLQAGQMRDQIATAQRTAPMSALEWTQGRVQPIGAMGGQQSGTSVQQTPANIPGMVLGGAQIAAGMATGNPFMALGGASRAAGGAFGGGAAGGAAAGGGGFGLLSGFGGG